jgi:ADP-ribosylglycohydrolase
MTGALSGAFLGSPAIPNAWLAALREEAYSEPTIRNLADQLYEKFATRSDHSPTKD